MKLAELIELALASGVEEKVKGRWEFDEADLMRFSRLLTSIEREACARQLDRLGCDHCADAIRARSEK